MPGFVGKLSCLAVLTITQIASAVTITFDTSDYSSDPDDPAGGSQLSTIAGDGRALAGQGKFNNTGNAAWTAGSMHAVVAGAGTNGSAAIVTSTTAAANSTQSYTPTASQWGGETFDINSSLIHFSFDVKLLSHQAVSSIARIWIGYQAASQAAVELYVQGDGDLAAGTGQSVIKSNAFDDGNDDDDANNQWHTVSGTIDHGTNTYTLLLDGQLLATRAFDRGSADAFTGFGGFAVNMRVSGVVDEVHNAIAIDNVVMTLPEPATAGILILGAAGLLRRRNRSC